MAKNAGYDRTRCSVLIICGNGTTSSQLRQALKTLGFAQMSVAPSHVAAIERVKTRPFTHIIFDAKQTDMPPLEFVSQIMAIENSAIMVAISEQPRIDDVFSLLRAGARHFIVPPFNTETVEEVFTRASDAPALSEAVLNAPDRNGAFTAVILNNLYRLSVSMRQAREFQSAVRDVRNYKCQLQESLELALLFCEGNENDLREKIVEGCLSRAKDAATRLGRLRKRLSKQRVSEDGEEEEMEEEDNPAAAKDGF
jgi:ActR/RegA family two-component response regulator